MFTRAQEALGSNYPLHALRHTAAYRMADDPDMDITDVQWILDHADLTTTQLYTTPTHGEVITAALAHHARQNERAAAPPEPPASGYDPRSLDVIFGRTQ
ncbi:site-specific integrase [Nocardia gipuzkoensis]|uniref:Tyr recombinase domain-containing protein n=2 Tax=Nocardia TaxID=1817 RepID=A0A7G1KJ30_9NOCA|nr:tyrosine-type recombinase/integrase [Nocardia gipuzkoensis]MCP2287142.1 Phage integrase family protein [Nocardia amikacinitolerans]RBO84483.1 phage integrase family protein [Nocardia puris]UGT65885.1 site-specific integrase [Nocardia gipuzkoensis]BCK53949.1 hypothetical protein NWFMUON74_17210 [Nocardia wallacei]